MPGSLNKVTLIGNVGIEPEIKTTQAGKELARLSIATNETWKDKLIGEKKEKTEWHRVVIFSPGLVEVVKNYIHKGSKLYIEGSLQTRKWVDEQSHERYTTEIVLQSFNSHLVMLDSKKDNDHFITPKTESHPPTDTKDPPLTEVLEDEIPF